MKDRMGMRTRGDDERGAAVLEFALVATLLMTILLGIIQYSLFFWSAQSGTALAREAVRRASVGACTDAELTSYVNTRITGATVSRTFLDTTGATVPAPGVVGGVVQVSLTFPTHDLNFPLVPLPASPTTKVVQARLENTYPTPTYGPCV
jgi:Flp pilus assembly protein TadG